MADQGGRLNPAREGEALPADVLATLPTPVLVIGAGGTLFDANVAAEALLNMSRAALIGRPVEALIGHPLTSVPADQPFVAYDLDIALPNGRHQRADLMAAPFPERPGWRSVTVHPREPRHLASRRAERIGGALTAVGAAALLAHEIKNPLSGIRGAAQLLEAGADPEARALTGLIRDEVDRIAALIDRMEGFTDTRPLPLGPQNIHAVLAHAREVAEAGFGAGFTFRETYDPSLPEVLGHRDALVQIFLNLLKNSVEALENAGMHGRTVTISTAYRHGLSVGGRDPDGQRVALPIEVCVIDEGPGAPEAIAEHLFDPFVSSKRSGGGIGLALVDKLVADHGGTVGYAREGRPVRTVFRVLLPRATR